MSKLLVSQKFVSDFNRVMKHYGCTEQEIMELKEDIRNQRYPFEHYEKWVDIMARELNE